MYENIKDLKLFQISPFEGKSYALYLLVAVCREGNPYVTGFSVP